MDGYDEYINEIVGIVSGTGLLWIIGGWLTAIGIYVAVMEWRSRRECKRMHQEHIAYKQACDTIMKEREEQAPPPP